MILVVRKPTNFELHGERVSKQVAHGSLSADFLHDMKTAHEQHYACHQALLHALKANNCQFAEIERDKLGELSEVDKYAVVMTVGGDGTLLSTSHLLNDRQLIVGIRSSDASVGHLCLADRANIDQVVHQIANSRLPYQNISRLRAKVTFHVEKTSLLTPPVVNDILFTCHNPAATTRYQLSVNDRSEYQKSSGIWFATATGSTAAISAAGGQPQEPSDPRFQYRVRELYGAKDQSFDLTGGFFDPDHDRLIIENRNEAAMLALDGQHGIVNLEFGDHVELLRGLNLRIAFKSHNKS